MWIMFSDAVKSLFRGAKFINTAEKKSISSRKKHKMLILLSQTFQLCSCRYFLFMWSNILWSEIFWLNISNWVGTRWNKTDTLHLLTFILTLIHNMLATCCYEENTEEVWLSRNCMYSKHICNPVKTQLSHVFKNTLRIAVFALWISQS